MLLVVDTVKLQFYALCNHDKYDMFCKLSIMLGHEEFVWPTLRKIYLISGCKMSLTTCRVWSAVTPNILLKMSPNCILHLNYRSIVI